ncbi:MAG: hypothetical protein K2X82_24690 [Gemmataceae bacterium]|nr:hypothetical protein [Gemmataceae bacterium]
MSRSLLYLLAGVGLCAVGGDVQGWGRGGGGFAAGGFRAGGYSGGFERGGGAGFSSFSGADRFGGSYSGSRSFDSSAGWGRSASGSYDHTWTNAAGGSVSTSGDRGAYRGPLGGTAVGGSRDTTVTTAGGKTYTADRQGGAASGPLGRTVGGASGSATGPGGSRSWETAFAGNRYTGNMDHYASVYGANGAHSTAHWTSGYMGVRAGAVRTGFGYYDCFHPAWYAAHPGCWVAAGWAAGAAWAAPTYAAVAGYCGLPADSYSDYDFGSNVVFQGDTVYVGGQESGTVQDYAQQATTIAAQGQAASPPADDWKPLGVFALVQGDEKTSNNIFQLAVNKDGVIRGNYYDGVTDTNAEVYGSVDKTTGLAAWTIGKKKDRVFEAGVYNLTQPQCPCLLHLGTQSTSQMMLVRVEKPAAGSPPPGQ